MEGFGIYSLKAGIILTLFWAIYRLFLQKETFYRFNRGFLLAGLFASLILPLIIIRYTVEINSPNDPISLLYLSEMIPTAKGSFTVTLSKYCRQLFPLIYLTVLTMLLITRSFGLIRLFRIIHRNKSKRYAGYRLIESSEFSGAFSFFRYVFVPLNLDETDKQIILKHENTHIEQKHRLDLLLVNALCLLWWYIPLIWLYAKVVKDNHEYLADRNVLMDYQPELYQQTLLNQWFKMPVFPIVHTFAYINQLNRIIMMKKNISNPLKKLSAFMAIPFLAVFLLAFSEKEVVILESVTMQQDPVIKHDSIFRIRSLHEGVQPLWIVDGKEVSTINDLNPENIENISVLKDASANDVFGVKGKNGVILITTKKGSSNQ
ncbi:MAG: hypothetical protein LBE79_12345 [Tannerella sp.]|jgi:TonB-dependent SusC/RagA subfamily outer membrane receptor|nr:hypothetical protein [Tannerella sp.]